MRFGFQIIGSRVTRVERELKHALQIAHRFGRCINRNRATRVRKTSEIVKAHDVVRVRVRENYSIHIADIFAQRLGPEISASVHDKRALWRFDINRRAQPVIARIGRSAHVAFTTDHRHALRCSGAEECDNQLRVES